MFYALDLSGITRSIAANCLLKSVDSNKIELILSGSQAAVYNEEHKKRIQAALENYFSKSLILEIELGDISKETPAAYRNRKEEERMQKAQQSFITDSNVQEIVERFEGLVQLQSIEPLTPEDY